MNKKTNIIKPPHSKLILASSLAINLLALSLPVMTMQVYDRIMTNYATETLFVLSTGVVLAGIIELCLRIARSIVFNTSAAEFEQKVSDSLLNKIMQADPRILKGQNASFLLETVSAPAKLKEYYGGQIYATFVIDAPFIVLMFGLMFYLTSWLALMPLMIILSYGYFCFKQGEKLKRITDLRDEHDQKVYNFITQALKAIHTVKAMCLEGIISRRFDEVQRNAAPTILHSTTIQGVTNNVSYSTGQLMTVMVVASGAPLVVNGHITVGMLVATIMLSGQIMQPLQRALSMWLRMQEVLIANDRIKKIEVISERPWHTHEELQSNLGDIKIQNLRFSYEEGKPVFDGINMIIQPGDVVAVQGASGAGKTTLMEIISGYHLPERGSIHISGMEAWRIPPLERSRYIAYLTSSGLIMRGSIMDNLTGFSPKKQKEGKFMADLLGISAAVSLLPAGYDTFLDGLSADVISPGLKQRISIARALLYKPRVILYDNADQGLDRESYSGVFSLLARLKRKATLVIVSEDKNIMCLADRVVELRQSQIIELAEPAKILSGKLPGRVEGRI